MSRRRQSVQHEAATTALPRSHRQLWLSADDVDLIVYLLDKYHSKHPLLRYLKGIGQQFYDDSLRMKELEARVRANAFWEEEHGTLPLERRLRKDAKKRHRKAESNVVCVTAKQMRKILKELERMPKEKTNGQATRE